MKITCEEILMAKFNDMPIPSEFYGFAMGRAVLNKYGNIGAFRARKNFETGEWEIVKENSTYHPVNLAAALELVQPSNKTNISQKTNLE